LTSCILRGSTLQALGQIINQKTYPGWYVFPLRVNDPGEGILDFILFQDYFKFTTPELVFHVVKGEGK